MSVRLAANQLCDGPESSPYGRILFSADCSILESLLDGSPAERYANREQLSKYIHHLPHFRIVINPTRKRLGPIMVRDTLESERGGELEDFIEST